MVAAGRLVLAAAMLWINGMPAVPGHAAVATALQETPAHYPDVPEAASHVYKSIDGVDVRLWVVSPAETSGSELRPAIVFFFGGGWRAGSPQQFVPHARYLAERGMVAVLADYRVSSRQDVKAVDCVEDARAAIRWVRSHAQTLGVDPSRICAAGGSAGGHLAACCGVIPDGDTAADSDVSSVPDAMALFNPAVVLAPLPGQDAADIDPQQLEALKDRMGVDPAALSPAHHVRSELPPVLIMHGKADTTVPYRTVEIFAQLMQDAGNHCELAGYNDAPHGFFNYREASFRVGTDARRPDLSQLWYRQTLLRLDTFLTNLGWLTGPAHISASPNSDLRIRGGLLNSLHQFQVRKQAHVAFLGGSITEMNGYRPRVMAYLQQRFPATEFTFTNAGIASTCSNTGAFRLERDVLRHGPVDLLLVEFAVNDDQDAAHDADGCLRGMEGIIRKTRQYNPAADIVMVHFTNPGMLELAQQGRDPISIQQHERVARYYQIPSVHLCRNLASRVSEGSFSWEDYGGTHPGPAGNQFAADLVAELMTAAWQVGEPTGGVQDHPLPEQKLLSSSFSEGQFLAAESIQGGDGWQYGVPDWDDLPGSKRDRFTSQQVWSATVPGSTISFEFAGTAVGAYVLAGPDAGQLEVSIDAGEWQTVELFHRFSKGLHYPRTVMFASDLRPESHQVRLRVGANHHPDSSGHAVRVLSFVVNAAAFQSNIDSAAAAP